EVEGGKISEVRLAYGSVAPTVIRCARTEAVLRGQRIEDSLIVAARAELAHEVVPIDDVRSTARYRLRVAGNVLEEFLSGLRS
ncbi:MAG: hypothetical protein LC802_14120, partial [Acidobacteria bacterium]|nr:hypothetical protein [Acidobacteriota bacterium]